MVERTDPSSAARQLTPAEAAARQLSPAEVAAAERQLFLLDRIIGLEATLAEWTVRDEAKFQILHAKWATDRGDLHLARLEDARLRTELTEMNAALGDVHSELHQTRLADAELRVQLGAVELKNRELELERDRLVGENAEIGAHLAAERAEIGRLQGEVTRLQSEVTAMQATRSWRLAVLAQRPLRGIRRIRRRG